MSFGITDVGFIIKSYDDVRTSLLDKARLFFGDNIDERSSNPFIQILESNSLELSQIWQALQQILENMMIVTAQGQFIDRIGFEYGVDRTIGLQAVVTLTISGAAGTVVPASSEFQTATIVPVVFETTSILTIGQLLEDYTTGNDPAYPSDNTRFITTQIPMNPVTSVYRNTTQLTEVTGTPTGDQFVVNYTTGQIELGTALNGTTDILYITYVNSTATSDVVGAQCTVKGTQGNVAPLSITEIVVPISGVTGVSNAAGSSGGTDDEAAETYRQRVIDYPRIQWTQSRIEYEVETLSEVKTATIISSLVNNLLDGPGTTFTLTAKPSNPLIRAELITNYGLVTEVITLLTEVLTTPAAGEFLVDYNAGTITTGDTLGAADKLNVYYSDTSIGEGYYKCFILGTVTPLTSAARNTISNELQAVGPMTIGFTIDEPYIVSMDFTLTLSLDTGYTQSTLLTTIQTLIENYILTLNVGSVMLRNEVIKLVMGVTGVLDITLMTIKLYSEQHYYVTGSDTYTLVWAQASSVIEIIDPQAINTYVKNTDWTEDLVNNQITWISANKPANGDEFDITYETTSGNVSPQASEIAKSGTVALL